MYSANDVPAWVEKYTKIPYLRKGRSFDGADCWGMCGLISENEYGRTLPSFDDRYRDERDLRRISEFIKSEKETDPAWIHLARPEEGAIVLFDLGEEEYFHCGIVISKRWFFQTMKGIGAGCERFSSKIWGPRIEGFYSFRS